MASADSKLVNISRSRSVLLTDIVSKNSCRKEVIRPEYETSFLDVRQNIGVLNSFSLSFFIAFTRNESFVATVRSVSRISSK